MRKVRASVAIFFLSMLLDWLAVVDMRLFVAQSALALPFTALYTLAWALVIQRLGGQLPMVVAGAVVGTGLGMLWP